MEFLTEPLSLPLERTSCSSRSNRSRIAKLAGSKLDKIYQPKTAHMGRGKFRHLIIGQTYDDRSVGLVMHLAPTFSQNEHDGFLLSHLVRRALQTWQAVFARLRGYAAVPRGAGRLRTDGAG